MDPTLLWDSPIFKRVMSVIFGALGGVVLSWRKLIVERDEWRRNPPAQKPPRDRLGGFFAFCLWPFVGGLLVLLNVFDNVVLSGWMAFITGFTAPATLQGFADGQANKIKIVDTTHNPN